jgi:hypothetical protein
LRCFGKTAPRDARGGARDLDGTSGGPVEAVVAEVRARGEAPSAVAERADAVADARLVTQSRERRVADLNAFAVAVLEADVRVGAPRIVAVSSTRPAAASKALIESYTRRG